jgi:hypothetical protein
MIIENAIKFMRTKKDNSRAREQKNGNEDVAGLVSVN